MDSPVSWLDDLNYAVREAAARPLISFQTQDQQAHAWLARKHKNGIAHEPATIAAMLAVARRRPVRAIWDIGAHMGYFSVVARDIWPDAGILMVEPDGHFARIAHENVPDAWIAACGVSDETGGKNMWCGNYSLYEEPEGGWSDLPERATKSRRSFPARVEFIRLDEIDSEPLPDLIKIDVEGHQTKAIMGGLGLFEKHNPVVIVEMHDAEKLDGWNTTNFDTIRPMLDLGYRCFWCADHRSNAAHFIEANKGIYVEGLSLAVFVKDQ